MILYTIDSIIKKVLINEGKPIHWYMQYLSYACDMMNELTYGTIRSVVTEKLTVTEYKAIILPCQFADWVRVGVAVNDRVKSLAQNHSINRLNNYDTEGNKIPYPYVETSNSDPSYSDFQLNRTGYDEFTGGIFNNRADWNGSKFRYLPERNEIQFDSDFPFTEVILEYITDGLSGDALTRVDPLAADTIRTYIVWQKKLNDRTMSIGERAESERLHFAALRKLRARKSPLQSSADILDSVRKGNSGTYKN